MTEKMKALAFDAVRKALKPHEDVFNTAREIALTIDGERIVIKTNYEDGPQVCASAAMTPIDVVNVGWDHGVGIKNHKAVEILREHRIAIEKAMTDAAYEAVAALVQHVPSEPTVIA